MNLLNRIGKLTQLVGMAGLIVVITAAWAFPDEPADHIRSAIYFDRLALAPFLVGRRLPQMDASMDDTLSCPIDDICVHDPTIAPNAGDIMTQLVQAKLFSRFGPNVVPLDEVYAAQLQTVLDADHDTPRTLARKLGRATSADLVMVGVVWRYRQPGAIDGLPEMPASVAFAVYLIDVKNGRQLWRGLYNGTQTPVTDNVLNASQQIKMGVRRLSADALARLGVDEALNPLPGQLRPLR